MKYEYRVERSWEDELEQTLQDFAAAFWKLHTVTYHPGSGYTLIFEREAP